MRTLFSKRMVGVCESDSLAEMVGADKRVLGERIAEVKGRISDTLRCLARRDAKTGARMCAVL